MQSRNNIHLSLVLQLPSTNDQSQRNWQLKCLNIRLIKTLTWSLLVFVMFIFRRVRKIAKGDYLLRHVCPSIRMEQLGSHWKDFYEI